MMLSALKLSAVLATLWILQGLQDSVCGEKVREVELTTGWSLRNQNGSIDLAVGKIPSSVYNVLSGVYGNVLNSYNDVNLRWIAYDNWTYTKTFNVNAVDFQNVRSVNLTLHGVDTASVVRLNDVVIGYTYNMFVRYTFNVLPYLRLSNVLEIEIISPVYFAEYRANELNSKNISTPHDCPVDRRIGECNRNMVRKMQTSFGGDFNLAAPSMGIWKTVTLEYYDVAIMRDIDVAVRKNDTHWVMDMRVFLSTVLMEDFYAELTFIAPDLLDSPVNVGRQKVSYASAFIEFKQEIPIGKVQLWWPNGYGDQKLYPLYFSVNCWLGEDGPSLRAKTKSEKSLNIGFRTVELVEEAVDSNDRKDSNSRTFLFKVNDVEMFMKGANYMPSSILPEFADDQNRVRHILKSAKEAHMNMIRVWGGGLYESNFFYSMTDLYGLLVLQDMAFTSATYPITEEFVEGVRKEIVHNAKRLAYHPSLVMFITNDEIELDLVKNKYDTDTEYSRFVAEYRQLFVGTVAHELNIISRGDFSPRPGPLRSTPSNGIELDRKDLPSNPQDPNMGDVHFWEDTKDGWNSDIYPRPRFVTKYGFQSLPITASWLRTMGENDTLIDLINHRQHDPKGSLPMTQLISRHLPLPSREAENYVEALIYLSQISQAMATKVATELFRSQSNTDHKTMGALFWHLNDVWVAPSCSSIDYYGNYKLLHYWSKEFLAPTAVFALYDSQNNAINVTLVREEINGDPEVFHMFIKRYFWTEVYSKKTTELEIILRTNDVKLMVFPIDSLLYNQFDIYNSFLEFGLSLNGKVLSRTFFFPVEFYQAVGISDPEITFEISWKYCNEEVLTNAKVVSYSLTIRITRPALFVYIELLHPEVERYELSNNGFVQTEPVKIVHLEFEHSSECLTLSAEHIMVKTVNEYMLNIWSQVPINPSTKLN